ncbi:MAG: hypothetical protein AAGI03_01265 [Pseudomonadota bacterium]
MTPHTDTDRTALGMATLSLLEALILILREKELISDEDLDEAFEAAIAAHRTAEEDKHAAAAAMLETLRVEGNSVRLRSD